MKKIFIFIFSLLLMFVYTQDVYAKDFNIYSNNAILYNINEDKVLYKKNINEKVQIASMTKIMTALVILEHEKDLDKTIGFDEVDFNYFVEEDLMISSLNSSKKYTYRELLYSFILESSADCGYALALNIGKTNKGFVKLMNDKARELGMTNSKFNDPVGLDDEINHYSTMSDMLILMKNALQNETLKEIMSTMKYKIDDKYIYHTIYQYQKQNNLKMPYLIGGKTGYNDIPGYALASFAEKENLNYILITTNASYEYNNPKHLRDAKTIYEYYFNNYNYHTVIEKENLFKIFKTKYLRERSIKITSNEDIILFLKNNYNKKDINYEFVGEDTITNYHKKGDYLGKFKIYYKNDLKKEIEIYLDQSPHKNLIGFIDYHKYIIIASLCYISIILSTVIIVKKIKSR